MYLGGKSHPFKPMNSLGGAKGCRGHCSLGVSLEVTGEWAEHQQRLAGQIPGRKIGMLFGKQAKEGVLDSF